jgi:pseudaminic acid cytidylyltransferase
MNLCIIPARGGSQRIPRKNIKLFCGKPMIAWSIEAAKASGCFDNIMVSTDDEEIAEVAQSFGADVPFVRPSHLSDDHTATIPVIAHAVRWQMEHSQFPTRVCCIYATAPFVQSEDIKRGLEVLKSTDANYAFSVTTFEFPIQRAIRITQEQRVEMFQPEHFETRSQDLEEAWHDAGQFYWGKASSWLESKPIFSRDSVPVSLKRHKVQDIDTPEDWGRAEIMFRVLQSQD